VGSNSILPLGGSLRWVVSLKGLKLPIILRLTLPFTLGFPKTMKNVEVFSAHPNMGSHNNQKIKVESCGFPWHFIKGMIHQVHKGVSKNNGTPKSSFLKGFSIINHPFWGTPSFGNTHNFPFNQLFPPLIFPWNTEVLQGRKVAGWLGDRFFGRSKNRLSQKKTAQNGGWDVISPNIFRYLKWRNPHLYKLYGYGLCKGIQHHLLLGTWNFWWWLGGGVSIINQVNIGWRNLVNLWLDEFDDWSNPTINHLAKLFDQSFDMTDGRYIYLHVDVLYSKCRYICHTIFNRK